MISPEVIARFEQLRDMATIAMATADGLRPAVLHWQEESQKQATTFESAARGFGRIDIRDGQPVRPIVRERTTGNITNWVTEFVAVPELAGLCADVLRVRGRLTEARERLDDANARAAALRRVSDEAREALAERGWREPR